MLLHRATIQQLVLSSLFRPLATYQDRVFQSILLQVIYLKNLCSFIVRATFHEPQLWHRPLLSKVLLSQPLLHQDQPSILSFGPAHFFQFLHVQPQNSTVAAQFFHLRNFAFPRTPSSMP